MKGKIKKILTTTVLSALTATAIGCSTNGNKIAKNIDKSMAQFVSSVNKLDYVETAKPANEKIGKIVETSTLPYVSTEEKNKYLDSQIKYLNTQVSDKEIENTITKPTDRTDDFKLFILSDIPFISLTSDDTKANISVKIKFSTDKIQETSSEIDEKINTLILKRSILLIYVNEIYNGNVNLSDENKAAINAYVNVIKENTSFLNGNRGMVKNQLKLASDLAQNKTNDNLVNYYIIKSGEALETRASKFDSTISAIDSITDIIENNLTPTSAYYNTKLSGTYENIFSNLSSKSSSEITNTSTNKEIADTLTNTLTSIFPTKKAKENTNEENGIATLPLLNNENSTNRTTEQTKNSTQNESITNNQNSVIRNNQVNRTNQNSSISSNTRNRNIRNNQTQNSNNFQNSSSSNGNFNNNQTNLRNLNSTTSSNSSQNNINSNVKSNNQRNRNSRIRTINRGANMNNPENNNTIRAERVPERVVREENVTSNRVIDENRAIKVPYTSSNR